MKEEETKAKQWQIGDWCQFKNGNKIRSRINCISPYQRYVGHTDNATWFSSFDEIEPIPLTEGILRKNGFEVYSETKYTLTMRQKRYSAVVAYGKCVDEFNFDISGDCKCIRGNKFRYVHELQHALRVCNLDDIADNFVV